MNAFHTRKRLMLPMTLLAIAAGKNVYAQPTVATLTPADQQLAAVAPSSLAPLPPMDATLLNEYRSHVEFLANPFMEGRGPGTRGNAIAAEYIEAAFKRFDLQGGYPAESAPNDIQPAASPVSTFRQDFVAGTKASLISGSIIDGGADQKGGSGFKLDADFAVLGFSESAEITAPLAFVGYGITKGGPDGAYSSFDGDADTKSLDGKIAVVFRFEPMGEDGKSLWRKKSDGLWSTSAGIADKINAVVKRGAVGVILVSPPECADPRSKKLDSTEGSARWMRAQDVPVVLMTPEAAERLLMPRDEQRRGIRQLRMASDTDGAPIHLKNTPVSIKAQVDRSPRKTWNIAGTVPGRGALANEYVVIGAHYDHVGYGYTGGSRTDEYGIVHPGADDNASGTAGLILAAKMLKQASDSAPAGQPRRAVLLVAFSAEELGLIGSRHFVKNSPLSASATYAMLNMDMIGRLRDNEIEAAGTGTAEGFEAILKPIFDASGLTVKMSPGGRGPSDHASFYGAGVPVIHLFTGLHEEYHTPRDTVSTINFEGGVRSAKLIVDVAEKLVTRGEPLAFKSTDRKRSSAKPGDKPDDKPGDQASGPSMGNIKVRFGIAPANYAEAEPGVGVGEVYPGTSAEEAGILKEDRLVRWNGNPIEDVENWMTFLSEHKPGDVVDVTIQRKGEESMVRVTLKSRDQTQR